MFFCLKKKNKDRRTEGQKRQPSTIYVLLSKNPNYFFAYYCDMKKRYSEENKFVFDFEHDGKDDIIALTGEGYQVEAFGKCFYYGYEFSDQVDGAVRSALIKHVKFTENLQNNPDITHFIQRAIDNLNKVVNLYDYDLVVMPESSSRVNQYMLRYIYRFAQPMLREMELIKSLPEKISFDMDGYERQYLNDVLDNGRPRYTEKQKAEVKASIINMMDLIHQKDYFTIAKDVKKSKMRPYITKFLTFKDESDKELCSKIHHQNVLVIDDITTSGSTLNEVLRALRVINEDNSISIFSLIGRRDLMVDIVMP